MTATAPSFPAYTLLTSVFLRTRTIDLHSCTDKRSHRCFSFLSANLYGAWAPVHGVNFRIELRCHPSFAVSLLIGCCTEQLLLVEIAALLLELQRYS